MHVGGIVTGPVFIFCDVEASGFAGIPVEIGWSILPARFERSEDAIRSDGFLVRPSNRWLVDSTIEWNPRAEALHGIARSTLLAEGLPIAECIEILIREWGGRTVWCDSRNADRGWLEVLFAEPSGVMGLPFHLKYWEGLFTTYWTENSRPIMAAREALAALPVHHRARLDAVRLALAFAAAWQADGRNT